MNGRAKDVILNQAKDRNNWTFVAIAAALIYFVDAIRDIKNSICDYDNACQEYVSECNKNLEKCALKMCLMESGDFDVCK